MAAAESNPASALDAAESNQTPAYAGAELNTAELQVFFRDESLADDAETDDLSTGVAAEEDEEKEKSTSYKPSDDAGSVMYVFDENGKISVFVQRKTIHSTLFVGN
jgi:hypothetical protein